MLYKILIDQLRCYSLLDLGFECSIVLLCIGKLIEERGKSFDEFSGGDWFVGTWNEGKGHLKERMRG